MKHTPLSQFHPLISKWFELNVGQPTEIQAMAWPHIINGNHVLVSAPTGSGKTLTAFLWAINQLATDNSPLGATSVLYVSPMKALNNDVQRNLILPLEDLKSFFENAGEAFPSIRVLTRDGDTSQSSRRSMLRHPPEILITTPESLNLLLSSVGGRSILTNISTVIVDEVHAVINSKRGVHLITAIERLVKLSGEFQRIALSATVNPVDVVANFIGGYTTNLLDTNQYQQRPVRIINSSIKKQYELRINYLDIDQQSSEKDAFWKPLISQFKNIISRNRSTLIFTNSRKLCEKITFLLNEDEDVLLAYSHHGSLSKELRYEVEQKLKNGFLRAIVATNSLELGIDIGDLDEVILIQSPPSISAAIQRVGRSGHQVGECSHAQFFPTHPNDIIETAVLTKSILTQDIETVKPIEGALDVLAQVITSMVGVETWEIDALYSDIRCSYCFNKLSRRHFDLVLNMLAGRYVDSKIRELKAQVSIDKVENTVVAKKGALLRLYMSGGTIPNRGYYRLRRSDNSAVIGELDEEYVWEARIGQVVTFGTQNWKIERITHNDVFVTSASAFHQAVPFWRGEEGNRDFHFSNKIGLFLQDLNSINNDENLVQLVRNEYQMTLPAAKSIQDFIRRQKEATGRNIPHRHHVLFEKVQSGPGGSAGSQLVIHTYWGGKINHPFALALENAWFEKFNEQIEVHVSNNLIVLQLVSEISIVEIISLVTSANVERHLKQKLENSGFFGARFRECAGRALLIGRNNINERLPLWVNRLRSQKLFDAVKKFNDFPILLETWRSCLHDMFDIENLHQLLNELECGVIEWSETSTYYPSPMAMSVSWDQINNYMYRDDTPSSTGDSNLQNNLIHEIVNNASLRPRVSTNIVDFFNEKRQRLYDGYSPSNASELLDWVKERLFIPSNEWNDLLKVIERDHSVTIPNILEPIKAKLLYIGRDNASPFLVAPLEELNNAVTLFFSNKEYLSIKTFEGEDLSLDSISDCDSDLISTRLYEWLQYYGPIHSSFINEHLDIHDGELNVILDELLDSKLIIKGQLVTDSNEEYICDSENYESLLRLSRRKAIPDFTPLDIAYFQYFLAEHQGISHPSEDIDGLSRALEQLFGYTANCANWETEYFP
ncbi:MAG: DEAD/DEAH box helicase, partial [Gammaproteobacteria bacterium]|nr:DEAD/DEAH box helicase [Gammaproteobacteria bacterium]